MIHSRTRRSIALVVLAVGAQFALGRLSPGPSSDADTQGSWITPSAAALPVKAGGSNLTLITLHDGHTGRSAPAGATHGGYVIHGLILKQDGDTLDPQALALLRQWLDSTFMENASFSE